MAIKEETVIEAVDNWLEDHGLNVHIDQSTEEGQLLNDAWNDWYNDSMLLPVNQAINETVANELSSLDIYDICDSILSIEDRIIALMNSCYRTGFRAACDSTVVQMSNN